MAPNTAPAFQFYAKDFLMGTLSLSLEECGAYIILLAYQWDHGSVPDGPVALARICRCSAAQAKRVWIAIAIKFQQGADGLWRNARLETERKKQADYRNLQREKGLASARNRASTELPTEPPTEPQPSPQPKGQPEGQPKVNSSSSSSFSEEQIQDTHNAPARVIGHGRGANSPGALQRDHRYHGHCGAQWRVCLSEATSGKLMGLWGGSVDDASPIVQEFIDGLEVLIGDGPKGDHLWLIQHFENFMATKGRTPIAAPAKPKPNGAKSFDEEIEEWARS